MIGLNGEAEFHRQVDGIIRNKFLATPGNARQGRDYALFTPRDAMRLEGLKKFGLSLLTIAKSWIHLVFVVVLPAFALISLAWEISYIA